MRDLISGGISQCLFPKRYLHTSRIWASSHTSLSSPFIPARMSSTDSLLAVGACILGWRVVLVHVWALGQEWCVQKKPNVNSKILYATNVLHSKNKVFGYIYILYLYINLYTRNKLNPKRLMCNFPFGVFLLQILKELQVTKAKTKGIAPACQLFISWTLQMAINKKGYEKELKLGSRPHTQNLKFTLQATQIFVVVFSSQRTVPFQKHPDTSVPTNSEHLCVQLVSGQSWIARSLEYFPKWHFVWVF